MTSKSLQIPFLAGVTNEDHIDGISLLLDEQNRNLIDKMPWPEFADDINASFSIVHTNDCIFIKYYVDENEVLTRYTQINDPVYKDSCVEFFISFDKDETYYNFEFNSLGTCVAGIGIQRESRTLLPVQVLEAIKHKETINQNTTEPKISWTLTVAIPIQVFCFHDISSLQHKKCKVNFYKCGDELSKPHYLAWNNIASEKPNFHLPEFFGDAQFE